MERNEINCFIYCLNIAISKVKKGDITGAQVYIENAQRSLREIEVLHDVK